MIEHYCDEVAKAIAVEKNFGSDRGKLNKVISRIPSENGRKDISTMFDSLLLRQDYSGRFNKFSNAMVGFEALTKLPLSFVKVPFHAKNIVYGFHGRMKPLLKGLAYTMLHHKAAHEEAIYRGVLAHQVDFSNMSPDSGHTSLASKIFRFTGFNTFYNEARVVAAQAARMFMEQDAMHLLKKGGTKEAEVRRILKDNLLVGDHAIDEAMQTGRWKQEDLAKAQVAFANETMYSNNPMQMPEWARLSTTTETGSATAFFHRALRATYSLQMFAVKTRSLLRKQLVDEVVLHHNLRPLVFFMLAEPVAGAAVMATSAALRGGIQRSLEGWEHKKHEKDAWDRFKEVLDKSHKGLAGKIELYLDILSAGIAQEQIRNLGDMLLNLSADPKKAAGASAYYGKDVLESAIGPIFNSTIAQPILTGVTEVHIAATNQKHPEKRNYLKPLVREAAGEVPITQNEPHLRKYLSAPPKKGVMYFPAGK